MDKELKSRFLSVYQNLPLSERKNVILVFENKKEPISWYIAYLEIYQETETGEKILDKLIRLNLI